MLNVLRSLYKTVSRLIILAIKAVVRAWWKRTHTAWKHEITIWKRTKNPSQRRYAGFVMLFLFFPILWYVSLKTSWITLLSFSFSSFLAISYATFFSKPQIFLGIFMGILIGDVANQVLFQAKDTAISGDLLGALITLGVAAYIMWWSRKFKTWDLPDDNQRNSVPSRAKTRRNRRKADNRVP